MQDFWIWIDVVGQMRSDDQTVSIAVQFVVERYTACMAFLAGGGRPMKCANAIFDAFSAPRPTDVNEVGNFAL